jgi:transposase-like protein
MGEFPRKSDGRRVFTVELRELDIQPSVLRQWKRRFEAGATAAGRTQVI